ncbi:transporter substrate-binding domain-containing protein [Paracerasibacillus soli]|uniref:Transporter substrate-binding domain-containing protein n=2 Tax=Paracerasibacillus soli TaxID=480284 RepID=A0ABU5CV23_9BACI|nr:transporter substrate-binding domain-containing protein [Virgibacillus soli]MDY0410226.1 transporter substrate-binding domain-containing protein [Virgibacillus soli]
MSKEATVLLDKVNDVLAEMKEDGTLTEISEQFYGGQDVSEKPNEEVIEIPGIAK